MSQSPEEFDFILASVCEAAVRLPHVEHSSVILFDPSPPAGTVRAAFPIEVGAAGKTVPLDRIAVELNLSGAAEPLASEDVARDERLGPAGGVLAGLGVRSAAMVPVVVDGRARALFCFDVLSEPHQFTPEELEHCKPLAQVVSMLIKGNDIFKETRVQAKGLEALRQATLAITREHERDPLLKTIIKQAVELLKARGGGIYVFDPARKVLEVIADYNRPSRIGRTLNLGEGMAGRLFMSADKFMATPDYGSCKDKAEVVDGGIPFGSVLEVPLLWKEKRTGILYVDDVPGRVFDEMEAKQLQRLATTVSIALEHVKLIETDRYKVDRLKALASATNDIIGHIQTSDVDERLTLIARYAHEILDAEACGIHRVERPGYLTLIASDGHREGGFTKGKLFKITTAHGTGLTGHIADRGLPFSKCGEELAKHFAVANKEPDTSRAGTCYSLLAIPFKKKGEDVVTGLLRISNKRGKDGESHPWVCFTKEDESIAEVFAQAAAVVLETGELVDEIRKGEKRYQNLLDACNIIVNAVNLDQGLRELADMLVKLLGKSFCRIFLIDESEKLLTIDAAVKHPSPQPPFAWVPMEGEVTRISEWHGLDRALDSGRETVLSFREAAHRDNLGRLSKKLEIKSPDGSPLTVQYLLSIPLKVGHRKVGLLNVGELRGGERGKFSDNEKELAIALARQVTLIIDKTRNERELTRRRNLDAALLDSISQIRAVQDVEELYRVIISHTASVCSCEVAGIVIQHPAGRALRLIDSGNGSRELSVSRLEDLAGFLGAVARTREPGIRYDFRGVQGEEAFLTEYDFSTVLATHVSFSSDSHCILFVGDSSFWPRIGRAEMEILNRLGQHSGISLTKALDQAQVTRARDGAYLVAKAMALDEMEVVLSNVLDKAVEGILKSVDCDTVTLYRLDTEKGDLFFPPEMAGVPNKAQAQKLLWSEKDSVMKRIRAINSYHPASDTLGDPLLDGEFVRREGIVSSAGIPIIAQNEKLGVLFVNYRRPHRFVDNDEKNMELFAYEVAVAIRNVQLYNAMKKQAQDLKKLNRNNAALQAMNLMHIATSIWRHNIQKLASRIRNTADMLLGRRTALRQGLEEITDLAHQLISMPVTAPLSAKEGVRDEPVNEMIHRHVEKLKQHKENKKVLIELVISETEAKTVRINSDWFNEALSIFTRNSLSVMEGSPKKALRLTTWVTGGQCRIEISDTGPGMSQDDWSKLFDEPVRKGDSDESMGVGLLLARMIIEKYSGTVHKISNTPKGVTLGFTLPLSN